MLLLLTLLLAEPASKRILIDSLLSVDMRSSAAIAREAGVSPAALSNLRRPDGAGQISSEFQDHILESLDWPLEKPNPLRSHRWKVRDKDGCTAVKWLLKEKLGGEAEFSSIAVIEDATLAERMPILVGHLPNVSCPCSISFHAFDNEVSTTFRETLEGSYFNFKKKSLTVSRALHKEIFNGRMQDADMSKLLLDSPIPMDDTKQHIGTALRMQFQNIGLDSIEYEALLIEWFKNQVRQRGEEWAEQSLAILERLSLPSGEYKPASMTPGQRRRLLKQIMSSTSAPV